MDGEVRKTLHWHGVCMGLEATDNTELSRPLVNYNCDHAMKGEQLN